MNQLKKIFVNNDSSLVTVSAGNPISDPQAKWEYGTSEDLINQKFAVKDAEIDDKIEEQDELISGYDQRINLLQNELNNVDRDIELLQDLYEGLTQSDVIVGSKPESGQANIIYRVPEDPSTSAYSDYMYYNGAWVKMAEYDNAIDDVPIAESHNLVESGGVAKYTMFDYPINISSTGLITNGTTIINGSYIVSDFVKVDPGQKINYRGQISVSGNFANICGYNERKDFVSALLIEKGTYQDVSVTIPSGINYIRVCSLTSVNYYLGKAIIYSVDSLLEKVNKVATYNDSTVISFGWEDGKAINKNNGNKIDNGDYACTSFIPVIENATYSTNAYMQYNAGYAVYDKDRNYISGGISSDIVIPSNGCYVRISTEKNIISTDNVYVHISNNPNHVFSPFFEESRAQNLSTEFIYKRINLQKSAFVTDDMVKPVYKFLPSLSNTLTKVDVSNLSEFTTAVSRYNAGENIFINLTDDLTVNQVVTLSGTNEILINGNSHKMFFANTKFTVDGNEFGYSYSNLGNTELNPIYHKKCITDKGNVLTISETEYFQSVERVLKEDGSNFDGTETSGVAKIKIPDGMQDITITTEDNVYIRLSTLWISLNANITRTSNGYYYFNYNNIDNVNNFNPDSDYLEYQKFPVFKFINFRMKPGTFCIKNNKIYYPLEYSKVMFNLVSNRAYFNITSLTGKVFLDNISFIGGLNASVNIGASNDNSNVNVLFSKCSFDYADSCIYNQGGAKVYVVNSSFSNIYKIGIYNGYHIVKNNFKFIGLDQNRTYAIKSDSLSYIAENCIEDYYYIGIAVNNNSIIEHNLLYYSLCHCNNMRRYGRIDGGAIYFGYPNINNTGILIRYNKIINYVGRGRNSGIYGDQGANNTIVIGNVIQNIPTYYAIYMRYVGNPEINNDNFNKIVAHNIVDNSIRVEGNPNISENGCKVGYNVINVKEYYSMPIIKYLENAEPQIITQVTFDNGIPLFNCVNTDLWGI